MYELASIDFILRSGTLLPGSFEGTSILRSPYKTLYLTLLVLVTAVDRHALQHFHIKLPRRIAKVGIVNEPFNPPSFSGYQFIGYRFPRHRL